MINNYKKFLMNKLEKEIEKIKELVNDDLNIFFNFLDVELFCVLESPKRTFLIVLNSYKDVTFEIEQKITNYKRFTKNKIKDNLHKLSFKKLLKNGLYMSEYSGKNTFDNYGLVHRLICCIKENCLGKQVNHIDENPLNNHVDNLQPLEVEEHTKVTNENRKRRKQNEIFLSL